MAVNEARLNGGKRTGSQHLETIRRGDRFSFNFNGKSYQAYPGDTIASALAATGIKVFN